MISSMIGRTLAANRLALALAAALPSLATLAIPGLPKRLIGKWEKRSATGAQLAHSLSASHCLFTDRRPTA
jgi:hypothetical protein